MSWTQVYVSGFDRAINPSDTEIEHYLCQRYSLLNDGNLMWAGEGSTVIKRDESGCCRGFAFLTFYSVDGAMDVVDRINNDATIDDDDDDDDDTIDNNSSRLRLKAELSNPKGCTKKKSGKKNNQDNLPDLRLRRQRKQPVRKHPVITSSDGKRTNLGNKTK